MSDEKLLIDALKSSNDCRKVVIDKLLDSVVNKMAQIEVLKVREELLKRWMWCMIKK